MTFIWSVFGFFIAMGILVTIHEWGHFAVAKLFNVKILTFSIGFGKPLLKKKIGETDYQLAIVPLGGYVKFLDERNIDEVSLKNEDLTRAFNRQSVYKRFLIVFAGPFINIIFAWLVFSGLYFWGVPGVKPLVEGTIPHSPLARVWSVNNASVWEIQSIDNKPVLTWTSVHQSLVVAKLSGQQSVFITFKPFGKQLTHAAKKTSVQLPLHNLDFNQPQRNWLEDLGFVPFSLKLPARIGKVLQNSPAQKAGFKQNDLLMSFNGKRISSWDEFALLVQDNPNKLVQVSYIRDKVKSSLWLTLGSKIINGKQIGLFGAALYIDKQAWKPYQTVISYPFFQAVQHGFEHSKDLIELTLNMIKKMFQSEISPANLSGPISIADYSGKALETGGIAFLGLLGLLSLSLGLLNLFPIPLLDGGHLILYTIEMIKGSPVNETFELAIQKLGLMIILSLTLFALINDLVRISND